MPRIIDLEGEVPRLGARTFVAPGATLVGDVALGDDASVWFGCVLRGDVGHIRIGARSNVQDLTMAHMTDGLSNLEVGADCTIGHGVILHGCRVEDACLVGMGSILLDGVVVGTGSLVGAGSLLPPRMVVPPGSLVLGNPAKVVRPVKDAEKKMIADGSAHYVANADRYRRALLEKAVDAPSARRERGGSP
jgi:carbonic anhydrase/acetyltransferase-like protein (isoleucine patch superfamily)